VEATRSNTKYIYADGQRVALRKDDTVVSYLLTDHLGSTAITANTAGVETGELRYKAWGEQRYTSGTTPTTFRFTGQRAESLLGLYFYGARWYDPALGRFLSPDTMIPNSTNPQSWDRFAYTVNNPVRYTDPTGHFPLPPIPIFPPDDGTRQALSLVFNWFFETGKETQNLGPENALTQEVMHDPGMDQFREKWSESGYQVPFSYEHQADDRSNSPLLIRIAKGAAVFVREHVFELGLSVIGYSSKDPEGSIDAVGGTIGSLDTISVSAAENGQVRIEVFNEMGWASGTRIPGTNTSLIQNRERNEKGLGGTTYQKFYWYEPFIEDK
jgi:RHS repeat-associated protein